MRKPDAADWAVFGVCGATTLALLLTLCDMVFRCGCRSWWTGAAEHCNIHTAGTHHCPWCIMPSGWLWATVAGILATQAAAVLLPEGWNWMARLAGGLIAAPVAAAAFGAVAGIAFQY